MENLVNGVIVEGNEGLIIQVISLGFLFVFEKISSNLAWEISV